MLSRRAALGLVISTLGLTATVTAAEAATSKKKPSGTHAASASYTGKSGKTTKTAKASTHSSKPKHTASAASPTAGS